MSHQSPATHLADGYIREHTVTERRSMSFAGAQLPAGPRIPNGIGNSEAMDSAHQAVASSSQHRGPSSDEVSQALGEKMLQVHL
jgi:hypothetical protein